MAKPQAGGKLRFRRALIKMSGEALAGRKGYGIDLDVVKPIARDIAQAAASGAQICLVVGAGNIYRGLMASEGGMDRARADYMGMLATVMNALALQTAIEREGPAARVLSAIPMPTVCEAYIRDKALDHLDKGRVVIFAGGTGNPYFTTDTAASLRAMEIDAEAHAPEHALEVELPFLQTVLGALPILPLLVHARRRDVADVLDGEHNALAALSPNPRPQEMVAGLGSRYFVTETAIKPFSVGYPIQAPLDAFLKLQREHKLNAGNVERIVVRLPDDLPAGNLSLTVSLGSATSSPANLSIVP